LPVRSLSEAGIRTGLCGFVVLFFLQADRQKNSIGPVGQIPDMPVEGRHRGAEFRPGQRFSRLDGPGESFAGESLYAESIEKIFPEIQVLEQMKGCGDSDDPDLFPVFFRFEFSIRTGLDLPPLPKQIEAGPIVADKLLRIVIPAAQKPVCRRGPSYICNGEFAVVGAEIAHLGAHRNGISMESQPAESRLKDRFIPQGQGHPNRAGEMTELGDMNRLFQPLLKCGHQCPVFGGSPLKGDDLSDGAGHRHFGQVVFPNRVQHRRQYLVRFVSLGFSPPTNRMAPNLSYR
jgi:hypothetical protein